MNGILSRCQKIKVENSLLTAKLDLVDGWVDGRMSVSEA
jgi:hypothetical protein